MYSGAVRLAIWISVPLAFCRKERKVFIFQTFQILVQCGRGGGRSQGKLKRQYALERTEGSALYQDGEGGQRRVCLCLEERGEAPRHCMHVDVRRRSCSHWHCRMG